MGMGVCLGQYTCSKAKWKAQFWKLSVVTVVLDTHIKCVDKVHKMIESVLIMVPQIN